MRLDLSAGVLGLALLAVTSTAGAQAQMPYGMRFGTGPAVTPAAAVTYYGALPNTATYGWETTKPWEITATAHALEDDPQKIFAFVRNNVRYEAKFGAQKGALGALIDRSGTAFDQAQLLVELLRAAGHPTARYAIGTIQLTGAQFQSWLGITDPDVAREFLANGGIPSTVTGTSSITQVVMGHAWVQVTISGATVTLDPAYKSSVRWTPVDVETAASFPAATFVSTATTPTGSGTESSVGYITGVNLAGIDSSLNTAATNLLTHLRTNFSVARAEQIFGGSRIQQLENPWSTATTGTLSATLGTYTAGLPDKFRTTLAIDLGSCDRTFFVDEIYGRRLSYRSVVHLEYGNGAAYGIQILMAEREGLAIGDQVLQALCLTSFQSVSVGLTANLPYAASSGTYMDRTTTKLFDIGSDLIIVHGWGDTGPELQTRLASDDTMLTDTKRPDSNVGVPDPEYTGPPLDGPGTMEEGLKSKMAAAWLAQMTRAGYLLEGVANVRLQNHYTIGVAYSQAHYWVGDTNNNGITDAGEIPLNYSTADRALRLDLDSGFSTTSVAENAQDRTAARHALAALGAMLEGSMAEQQTDAVDSASTPQRMPWAQENFGGTIRYHAFTQSNYTANVTERRDGVTQGTVTCQAGRTLAGTGFTVILPNDRFIGPGTVIQPKPYGPTISEFPGTLKQHRVPQSDTTMQRGCAWIAFNSDASEIAHVITSIDRGLKGGGGPGSPEFLTASASPPQADLLKDGFEDRSNLQGVDLRSGALTYKPEVNLSVGSGDFPYSLTFQPSFQSGSDGCPGCMFGWTHNLDVRASLSGGGLEGMGSTNPLALAPPMVAVEAIYQLYRANPGVTANHLAGAATMRWLTKRLTNNVASVTMGASNETFVRLADNTFAATPGSQTILEQTGDRRILTSVFPARRHPSWEYDTVSLTRRSGTGDAIAFAWRAWNPSGGNILKYYRADVFSRAQGFFASSWTFPEGMSLTFSYCFSDPLDPLNGGFGWKISGSCTNRLERVTNSLGIYISLDGATPSVPEGLRATTSDGRSLSMNWDVVGTGNEFDLKGGLLSSITDPVGQTWNYSWERSDASDRPSPYPRLISVTRPAAATAEIQFTYDTLGRVREVRDGVAVATANPARVYTFYAPDFEFGARKDPLNGFVRIRYDFDNQPIAQTNERGFTTKSEFDAIGRLTARVLPLGDRFELAYDARHNLTQMLRRTRTGFPAASISATYTYAPTCTVPTLATCNRILTATNPNGGITDYVYFPSGRLQQTLAPTIGGSRATTSYLYNTLGQLTSVTDPVGRVTEYQYHPLNAGSAAHHTNSELWKQIVDPGAGHLALTTTQTYDDAGNVVGVTDPRGGVSAYQWNVRRLLTHGESPTTSSGFPYVVEHDYDTSGRRTATRTISNAGGWETTSSLFDADGRPITVTDPAGDETQTAYDLLGRVSIVTDPMARKTLTEYFPGGLVQVITEANGTPLERDARTNAYNGNGELLSVTSAKGFTTSYQYDAYGRLSRADYPVTSTSLNPNFESIGYDNNGNPTSRRTRSNAQYTLVYDAMNRLIRETGPDRRETFGYDASSLRTCAEVWPAASGTTTCGSGSPTHRIAAALDLAMRVSSESARRGGTTRTVGYQYDANGNRTRITWPDGWYAAYFFDAFNQLTAVDDSTGAALWRQSWRRDARLGQILRTGTAWGSGGTPAESLTDLSYEADGDVSLMSHRFLAQGAGTQFNFSYGYNLASQLVSEVVNQPNWQWVGTTADTVPYAAANALDQYPSVDGLALTHDTNGNRTGYAGLTTTHDAENRLTAASKTGMSVSYMYDADGRRVGKDFSSGGSDTDFLSAGQMEIAEYDSTGKLLRRYVPGIALNERLAMINCGAGAGTCPSPATFSYTTNRQGSIIALTDGAGAISDRYVYTPYGVEEPLATSANPFRYTGQRFDPETGLYYYHARYYDPQQGKFLETDPVGYEDDLNLYAYSRNDPTNKRDPTGKSCTRDSEGKADKCTFDQVKDRSKLTPEQQKLVARWEADYTNAVKQLQANPDKTVPLTVPKPGADGKPTEEKNSVEIRAGVLANYLIRRHMIVAPNETGQTETSFRGITTIREPVFSGNVDLEGVRGASAALVRSITILHEGIHGTHFNNVLAKGDPELYNRIHQFPFNKAAYDLLYR